ncbi:MAG: acetoacetate decarboxylase family protein [Acidimicrobiia bacterium]
MLSGTATTDELMAHAATMARFDTAACVLPGTQVLQLMFETAVAGRQTSLPAGLHPTNPPSLVLQAWQCPESEWGAFSLAAARVQCRSGLRPRGFVQACVVDNADAAAALASRWGFPTQMGEVTLDAGYHDTHLSVVLGGETVLAVRALDPLPLGNDDVAFSGTLTLANTPRGPRLVQVDVDLVAERAERLVATMPTLDAAAFGLHPSVVVTHPVSASLSRGELTLQPLRYVCRPDELAFTGTESTQDS